MAKRRRGPDPLRLEVFHHLFAAVSEEMGAALMRSAFSPNIRERRDFSCALFDAQGRALSQAAHIPVHLGSLPLSVAAALEEVEMGPGDAVVLNDPFRGGTHLPDITLVSGVFLPGRRSADFYCANRAHHADVGGAHPGSMAPAVDVHAEGLRIPPLRLVRAGRADRAVLELLLANMRVPREREGDLLAQVSANRLGARRLAELAREHGAASLHRRAGELMDWTERLCRARLAELPAESFEFSDELEVAPGRTARLHAVVRVRSGWLEVDLRACDDQVEGGLSAPRAVALSAVLYVLRLLLPPGTPANDGVLRCVRLVTRPGSLVDARYPAAVASGNVETSQRLVDVLLGALARAAPDRVPAASSGTMSNLTLGRARAGGAAFSYYETIAGGAGGSPQGPGAHAVHTHMTNTRNTPIEELENALPVRVLACSVRRGSGGAGLHPGGDGVTKRLRFLEPAHVAWIADRSERGAWGLEHGGAGASGSARLLRERSARSLALPSKVAFEVAAGDELELCTPGGGGWGRAKRAARAGRARRSAG